MSHSVYLVIELKAYFKYRAKKGLINNTILRFSSGLELKIKPDVAIERFTFIPNDRVYNL